jgi:uncharacterized protein YmfQ (DUF2313 family)
MMSRANQTRAMVETLSDAPLAPALRLAVHMGGAATRTRALRCAIAQGRDRDARTAVARIAAARADHVHGHANRQSIPRARHALIAARRAGLAAVAPEHTNV